MSGFVDNGPFADMPDHEHVDMDKLSSHIAAGIVRAQAHPYLPLTIYKYTQQCVYQAAWDEVTLRCRGVVLDHDGKIVVNGFPKFFNHTEPIGQATLQAHEGQRYEVTEKLDGSLIQAALWEDHLIVTSSGAFDSEQAGKGMMMLDPKLVKEGLTYLFEVIYPGNRIVLDYGNRQSLALLAIRETGTGEELPLDPAFECVKTVSLSIQDIEAELSRSDYINKEGYIIRWEDGSRVKMKYAEYMRLHKIVSGVNEKYVWEALRDGADIESSLRGVPDELLDFVRQTKQKLLDEFERAEYSAKDVYEKAKMFATRKEQASEIIKAGPKLAALAFCMLDGKPHAPKLWKMLEPEANSTRWQDA